VVNMRSLLASHSDESIIYVPFTRVLASMTKDAVSNLSSLCVSSPPKMWMWYRVYSANPVMVDVVLVIASATQVRTITVEPSEPPHTTKFHPQAHTYLSRAAAAPSQSRRC